MYIFVIADKLTGEIWHCASADGSPDEMLASGDYPIMPNPMPDNFFCAVIMEDEFIGKITDEKQTRFANEKNEALLSFCSKSGEGYQFEAGRVREELQVFPNPVGKGVIHRNPIINVRSQACKLDIVDGRPVDDMENYEEWCLDSWNAVQQDVEKEKQRNRNGGLDDEALAKLKAEITNEVSKSILTKGVTL